MLGASVERPDGGTPLENASARRGADSRPGAAILAYSLEMDGGASKTGSAKQVLTDELPQAHGLLCTRTTDVLWLTPSTVSP
jgi:hypothetical protein